MVKEQLQLRKKKTTQIAKQNHTDGGGASSSDIFNFNFLFIYEYLLL
jgi:hypothetical protein